MGFNIKNFLGPYGTPKKSGLVNAGGSFDKTKNLSNVVFPASLERARKDLDAWRDSIREMENGLLPYRVKFQKLAEDTVLNEHVAACMERRKDLTLLRDFEIVNANGERDKTWTEYFKKTWYAHNFLNYTLDALWYGYNLISIGDIIDGVPVNPSVVRRWNVSPDRQQVSTFEYMPSGWSWNEEPYNDWHVFVKTLPTNGISNCGYGLLYNIAKTEIFLRNNLAFNINFIEMFAQPYRVMKTNKSEGPERDAAEKALQEMGSAGYILMDLMDELEFMSDGMGGNGYKSYNDIEHRLEAKISKYTLGHADAIDSVPGKLGGTQLVAAGSSTNDAAASTPVAKALRDKQTKDGGFVEPITNELLIPKLRRLGIAIPEGHRINFLNDAEEREIQNEKNRVNQAFATTAMTLRQAGLIVDPAYATQVMGIPVKEDPNFNKQANSPAKEPKDAIESGKPLKEESKKRDGKA
jgi:hypothetical protein